MSAAPGRRPPLTFTAVTTYESPSRLGPPLAYTTISEVTLQRPDKLRVITPGDGPASEFYYDGKTMMAFAPAENLVAVADAPPTIDAALKAAYDSAAIYFPFTDVLVADPYKDIADGLKLAFYIGQSHVVGGTTTDMLAIANDHVFAQLWIGADDKLPRMMRAVYLDDPARLRHQVEFSNWKLDGPIPADAFARRAPAARRASSSPVRIRAPGTGPQRRASRPRASPNEHERERTMRTIVTGVHGSSDRRCCRCCVPAGAGAADSRRRARGTRVGQSAARGAPRATAAAPPRAATGRGAATGFRGGTASGGDGSWQRQQRATAATRFGRGWVVARARRRRRDRVGRRGLLARHQRQRHDGLRRLRPLLRWQLFDLSSADRGEPLLRSGCYDCGGWNTAGAAAVGLAAGTAIGAAGANAASANAYAAGVAAGGAYAMGAIYPSLPAGCIYRPRPQRLRMRRAPGSAPPTGRTGSTIGWCPLP